MLRINLLKLHFISLSIKKPFEKIFHSTQQLVMFPEAPSTRDRKKKKKKREKCFCVVSLKYSVILLAALLIFKAIF